MTTNYNAIDPITVDTIGAKDLSGQIFNINGGIATSDPKYTIYDLEKNLIDAINIFYSKYANYLRCTPHRVGDSDIIGDGDKYGINNYRLGGKPGNANTNSCVGDITLSTLNTAQNAVKSKADALKTASTYLHNLASPNYIQPDMSSFNNAHNDILNKYSDNLNLRNELDLKMKEILKTDDSFVNQSKLHYDSTMYASIGWTILATSLLYYVFRKL